MTKFSWAEQDVEAKIGDLPEKKQRRARGRAPPLPSFGNGRWVLDEMQKARVGRMGLPGPETLHAAHVFTQLEVGLYTGHNAAVKLNPAQERKHPGWSDHILADAAAAPAARQFLLPLGVSGRATQADYAAIPRQWALPQAQLRQPLQPSRPRDQDGAAGRPAGSVRIRAGASVRAGRQRPGESRWDEELGRVRLHHTEEDKAAGDRAFFKETLEVTNATKMFSIATNVPTA